MLGPRPTTTARAPYLYALPRRFRPRWPTILVVADDAVARRRNVDTLRADGYTVHVADAYRSAMVILRDFDPSLTLVDLPATERAHLVDALRGLDADARILIVDDQPHDELRSAVATMRRIDEEEPPAA